MDPAMIPIEPETKEAGNRRFCWFKKADWSRPEIETYLEGKFPGYERATWFDQGDTHKVIIDLPRSGRK